MIKKRLVFLNLLIIFLLSNQISAQWLELNSSRTENFRDVCFVDSLYGWVIDWDTTLIHTYDGGKTWNQQKVKVDSGTFHRVDFIDRNVGFIVGKKGLLYKTINGGKKWSKQNIGSNNWITDISIVDENNIWLTNMDFSSHQETSIFHTSNGGLTWDKNFEITSDETSVILFSAVHFISDSVGWALASPHFDNFDKTTLFFTVNGGNTWEIKKELNFPFFDISALSEDTIWCGGNAFASTIDGGDNWNYELSIDPGFNGIAQFSSMKGWILNNSEIKLTNDGINNFESIDIPTKHTIFAIDNIGNTLWLVGTNGSILRGSLLTVGIREQIQSSSDFETQISIEAYPNPFNSSTRIKIILNEDSNCRIDIYDLLGRNIQEVTNSFLRKGTNYFDFNETNLSSGTYIVVIQTELAHEQRKIVLLK